jgi:hypothetical protein
MGREKKAIDGKTLAELARGMTHEALETVRNVMRDGSNPPHLRLQAAEAILRRGWSDSPRNVPPVDPDIRITIAQVVTSGTPIPGVLASPVAGHVWQAPTMAAAEVVASALLAAPEIPSVREAQPSNDAGLQSIEPESL